MNNLLSNKMALAGVVAVVIIVVVVAVLLRGDDGETSLVPEGFTEVKIGTIGPLTGDSQGFGMQIKKVLDYNLSAMNKIGESKKIVFRFIHEDGACDSETALAAYDKLTKEDNVQFIIGGACSAETLAIGDMLTTDQILAFSAGSSNPEIEGKSDYLFSFSYSDEVIATAVANEVSQHSRVAIITEDNAYNTGLTDAVKARLADSTTTEIVADEVFAKGSTDFVSVLESVKTTNPDAIFLNPNIGVTAENLVRDMATVGGWDDVALYGQFSYISADALAVSPEITNGMVIIDAPQIDSEGFATLYADIAGEEGALADLGPYYVAASLDASTLLARLIADNSSLQTTPEGIATDNQDSETDGEESQDEEATDTDSDIADQDSYGIMVATAEMVRNALISKAHTDYYLGTIDLTSTSFVAGIGVGKYMVEEGVAVWKEAYL